MPATQTRIPTIPEMEAIHLAEQRLHDLWAKSTELDSVRVRESFESPCAPENRYILGRMGDLQGKSLLDIGCGLGESSVYLASRGADVTAVDLSPGMIEKTKLLARKHGVTVRTQVVPAETIPFEEGTFDFVYAANVMHHVQDRENAMRGIYSVLKPGGKAFLIDPLAYNPVINVYRRIATEVRSDDEQPLSLADMRLFKNVFQQPKVRMFWISTLALFLKYYLVDGVHPNADRYWKRILDETPETLSWFRPLAWADRLLTRLPLVKLMAWNVVMEGSRES